MMQKGHKASKRAQKSQTKQQSKLEHQIRKHNEIQSDGEEDRNPESRPAATHSTHQSVLLEPYRAFGYYTSSVPICVYKSGEDTLIASVVGKHAFYVFNTEKLNLVFMSRFIAEEITYLQAAPTGLIYTSLRESN